jgi:hypothetical protein
VGQHVLAEVDRAPLPRAAQDARDGAFEGVVLIGHAKCTPARSRLSNDQRNSIQKMLGSTSPMSTPITSRGPIPCTAQATTSALQTTQPWSL